MSLNFAAIRTLLGLITVLAFSIIAYLFQTRLAQASLKQIALSTDAAATSSTVGSEVRTTASVTSTATTISASPGRPNSHAMDTSTTDITSMGSLPSISVSSGIYPVLRELGCQDEHGVYRFNGTGKYLIDVGLGPGADETFNAVEHGFVVFSFEPLPGNIGAIRSLLAKNTARSNALRPRVHFVQMTKKSNKWSIPDLPKPRDGKGFAFIFAAGLSDQEGSTFMSRVGVDTIQSIGSQRSGGQEVPVLTIDTALPTWVDSVHFIKIDTQGWELKVLRGARHTIATKRIRYIQYEFSPWLMRRAGSGDPMELLRLLTSSGAMCFEGPGYFWHNRLPHPISPLDKYYDVLNRGENGGRTHKGHGRFSPSNPMQIGPWDDVMCMWLGGDSSMASTKSDNTLSVQARIFPTLLELGCGEFKDIRYKFVVDVGLGLERMRTDTAFAVEQGAVVFGFDPVPDHIAAIKDMLAKGDAKSRSLSSRVHFVQLTQGETGWSFAQLPKPEPGKGILYIFEAGVSDGSKLEEKTLPVVTLDKALPEWVDKVDFLRVDTGGSELRVIRGVRRLISERFFRYVEYRFWPGKMRSQESGDPTELLELLPSDLALCFQRDGHHGRYGSPADGDRVVCYWPETCSGSSKACSKFDS